MRRNRIRDHASFELALRAALEKMVEAEMKDLPPPEELARMYSTSPEFDEKVSALIYEEISKRTRGNHRKQRCGVWGRMVACAAMIMCVVCFSLFGLEPLQRMLRENVEGEPLAVETNANSVAVEPLLYVSHMNPKTGMMCNGTSVTCRKVEMCVYSVGVSAEETAEDSGTIGVVKVYQNEMICGSCNTLLGREVETGV